MEGTVSMGIKKGIKRRMKMKKKDQDRESLMPGQVRFCIMSRQYLVDTSSAKQIINEDED